MFWRDIEPKVCRLSEVSATNQTKQFVCRQELDLAGANGQVELCDI